MIRFLGGLLLVLLAATAERSAWATVNRTETATAPIEESAQRPDGTEGVKIGGIRVGFAGRYQAGLWTPVVVTLRGTEGLEAGRVAVTVPDGDGVGSRFWSPLPSPALAEPTEPDGSVSVRLYVRIGRRESRLNVEIFSSAEVIAQRAFQAGAAGDGGDFPAAMYSDQDLIVVLGTASVGAEELAARLRRTATEKPEVVRLDGAGDLPDRWYGYESVDAVIVAGDDGAVFAGLGPQSRQIEALDEWVRLGGKLVLCAGSDAEQILGSRPEGPLARFVPGRLWKRVTLPDPRSLELYCESTLPIRSGVEIWQLADVDGVVDARHGNVPLVVRRARGFGQVVFFAGDLAGRPLGSWQERRLLVARLLGISAGRREQTEQGNTLVYLGYGDVAGQLRSALDRFDRVWRIPFGLVVAIVVLYLLAIGPGDYFLVGKILRRLEWTWISFPLTVAVFCVGGYLLAHWSKGDQVRLNQVDLIDVDTESGLLRGTTWATVFSPAIERYDLSVKPRRLDGSAAKDAEALVSWLGLPGTGLGGMNPATAPSAGWRRPYDFSLRLDAIKNVPIRTWSTKSFTARWTSPQSDSPRGELVREGQVPRGTITNTFDFTLADCLLAYGNWAYELGTLAPGESARVGPTVMRRELNSLLTGRKLVFEDLGTSRETSRETAIPYDRQSPDESYILRAMTFFAAAGGKPYTGLSNSHQEFVDMSDLLRTDRAVLVAWAASADKESGESHGGAEIALARRGRPLEIRPQRHLRLFRFVFPVTNN